MIRELFRYFHRASHDPQFRMFQDDLAQGVYEGIGKCASKHANELEFLDAFIGALDSRSHDRLRLHARRIHGKRSFVQFRYHDQPTTKELGDTALITCATSGGSVVYERLSLIQHKVIRDGHVSIDPAQLFLLKNFPQFTSDCGILRSKTPVKLTDFERALGAFGFFTDDAEFIYSSAERLAHAIGATTTKASREQVCRVFSRNYRDDSNRGGGFFGEHLLAWQHPKYFERYMMHMGDFFGDTAMFQHAAGGTRASTACSDLHEFTHDLAGLRIGGLVSFDGASVDQAARTIAQKCLRLARIEGIPVQLEDDDNELESDMVIIVAHVSLE
jgi:hypothetical protein